MNNSGFYKKDETQILFAPNIVEGANYVLVAEDKDTYDYPVDGWIWANSLDDAISYFANNSSNAIAPFDVQPENYKLAANKEDEAEFGKLIALLNLSLQQNRILPTTEITIWDYIKMPHSITVQRFLEIMVDYGFYCYQQRS
jgi:hypothetical protein